MASYRYFKPEEFVACNPPCSIDDMNEDFMRRLDDARSLCSYRQLNKEDYKPQILQA